MNLSRTEPEVDITQFSRTIRDIPYAGLSHMETLDIIYPDRGAAPYPVIVAIHGGAWIEGDKKGPSIWPLFKAPSQGYALVTIDYRLSPEARWPAQLNDAKAAIRFLRAHAQEYDLKTDTILVWGCSAGGHIAEMLGATNGRPEFEDLTMGNAEESSAVQGVISWYGASDMASLAEGAPAANEVLGYDVRKNADKAALASPITYVTEEYPPILLVHGTGDKVVPYEQRLRFYHKVNRMAGMGRAQIKLFQGAVHGDARIESDENVRDNLYFADEILWDGNNPYRTDALPTIRIKK